MNFVEQNTWNHLSDHITRLDPNHEGWCIDVGVGEGDYYFEWFSQLAYKTLAIEPLLTEAARRALEERNIVCVETALGQHDGETTLYTTGGIHSLYKHLWGSAETSRTVPVHTWRHVIELVGIDRVTALKLDIEGGEGVVIRQLWDCPLPLVLSFEFGGLWQRASGHGPWSVKREAELMLSLRILFLLGYTQGVVISSGDSDRVLPITLARRMDIEALFTPDCNWGNIVVWREE